MRILIAHNRYQQRGGEDAVVANEATLLASRGHDVEFLGVDNEAIRGIQGKLLAAAGSFYSVDSARLVAETIDRFQPDIVHVHNFLATLSPSVLFAARRHRVPTVVSIHNYRLLCANALLFRDGHVCEECIVSRSFLPGVAHACYRGSRIGSAIVGGSMALHDALGTWQSRVDRYITLTRFAAGKIGGDRVPADRIRVKPNFVEDSGVGDGGGGFALFTGRLAQEKGIETLIEADARGLIPMPLYLAGDGPMADQVRQAAARNGSSLHPLGARPAAEVQGLMRKASVLVVPSVWYEGFPMVCVEALAAGLPILCSRIGGLAEIVEDGVSGCLFPPGDAEAMANAMRRFAGGSIDIQSMRQAARQRYLTHFSPERNYAQLMAIYGELTSVP